MRELATWTDYRGRQWPIVQSSDRLHFAYPSHAALRAHVFHADGYKCRRCPAAAIAVPDGYDGRFTLCTNTTVHSMGRDSRGLRVAYAWSDVLILDHALTRAAGGLNRVENLQTLCETCNKRKQREDRIAAEAYAAVGCN